MLSFVNDYSEGAHERILQRLLETNHLVSPTNQIFLVLENTHMKELAEQVAFSFWERLDESRTVVRFATSWATRMEGVEALIHLL